MSRTRAIAKNTVIQIAGRAVGTVLGLITLGTMTRALGAAGYGAFTTVTSFLQFFGILVDFGLSLTTVAMLSEHGADQDRIASNIFTLRIVSAAIFFALAPLAVLLFPYSHEIKSGVSVAAASFFLIAVNQVLTSVLQKELRMARAAVAEVLGRLGLLAGTLAAAYWHLGLHWLLASLVIGNALTALCNWQLVRTLVRTSWRFDWPVWKDIIDRSWPIALSITFNLVYLKGDVIALSLTRSQAEVGVYGAAYKILDVLTVIPIMFMGLVLPLLVKARHEKNEHDWKRIMQKAFDFMALLAMPLVAGTIVVGPAMMRLFAGGDFGDSGRLLQILILACAAVFFGSFFGHAIIAARKQRSMVWGYAIDAILATALYALTVPTHGPIAAAWVTVASEVFIACATFFVVWRATKFAPSLRAAFRAAVAAILMAAVIAGLPPAMHVLFKIIIGAGLYAGLALLLRAVSISTLKELLGRGQPEIPPALG